MRYVPNLIQNLTDATRADSFSSFADGKANRFFHRDRRDQLDFNRDVVAGHDHFHAFGQFDRASNVRGAKIKLWPIIREERRVTSTFLLAQHVNFRLKLLVRRNRSRLGDNLAAFDILLLQSTQQNAHVIARARFIEKFAKHFDISRNRLGRRTNSDQFDFSHFLENPALNTAGGDGAAAFNVKHVFDRHQEWLINRPLGNRNVIVDRLHEGDYLLLRLRIALPRFQRTTLNNRDFVSGKFILCEEIAHFHLDQIEKLGVINHVDLIQENDNRGHTHLSRKEDVFAGLWHRSIRGGDNQDRAIHLCCTGDHVLDIVGV